MGESQDGEESVPGLEIGDRWRIEPYTQGFKLVEVYETENDEGESVEQRIVHYFRTVLQCLKGIRRKESKDVSTVEELIEHCNQAYEIDRQALVDIVEERDRKNPFATYLGVEVEDE